MMLPRPVLVAEDNPTIAGLIKLLLELEGFAVVVTHCGEEALELLGTVEPVAVVTDYAMPGISGADVCRSIRAERRYDRVPVVLYSSADPCADMLDAVALGGVHYLIKTAGPRRVAGLVTRLVPAAA